MQDFSTLITALYYSHQAHDTVRSNAEVETIK